MTAVHQVLPMVDVKPDNVLTSVSLRSTVRVPVDEPTRIAIEGATAALDNAGLNSKPFDRGLR